MTDSNGYFHITLSSIRQGYTALFDIGGLPAGSAVIVPSGNTYSFDTTNASSIELNGLVSSSSCRAGACWLTAGGVKFDPVLGIRAAENGPRISFGGNTFPGCSPVAGDGGQWNFVDHGRKLHFQGWNIEEVTCGNVSGIPAGSTSPVTPYNYIDFRGVGTLKGIAGNKVMHDPVYFFVHAEDRNEPGNENALSPGGGDSIDRLFMRVYTNPLDPPGTTLFLVDVDGNSGTVDPITITGGNIQIHVSSCP
ncbi:MAG: hypothetical protein IH611_10345 [Deltaproteobacteria bacterium]|nr:hypothetical protein [Deltaproteobacteria bacterium]